MGRRDRSAGLNIGQPGNKAGVPSLATTGQVCISKLSLPMHHLKAQVSFSKIRPSDAPIINGAQFLLALLDLQSLFISPSILYSLPGLTAILRNFISDFQWNRSQFVIDKLGFTFVMVYINKAQVFFVSFILKSHCDMDLR